MTRHRPSNKRPTGVNKSLGNSLKNERDRNRKAHKIASTEDDMDNPAFLEEENEKAIDSKTFETSVEELLAKADLAGMTFEAERGQLQIVDKESTVVIRTASDVKDFNELQRKNAHLLKIPRRPDRSLFTTPEELHEVENRQFLDWRIGLAELAGLDGVVLTPFERNLDIWRELWRVVERSDIIVQIVDARNPLLFRSADLEDYVTSVDPAKKNLILVNKADLLLPEQQEMWAQYFGQQDIDVVFWSALEPLARIDEPSSSKLESSESDVEEDETSSEGGEADAEESEGQKSSEGMEEEERSTPKAKFVASRDELLRVLREKGGPVFEGGRPLTVGFVGYPNVGKSSTINKLIGSKKVTVSATPGKTKRLQTIILDDQLTLCDCPGLVMPSFAMDKNEMFLNGIMPIDQMRDHFGPTALLLSRVPAAWLSARYSLTLPSTEASEMTAHSLLTAIAFMRGLMSSSGVPDCSRAARLLIRDVVSGSILWVAAPPTEDQTAFDQLVYPAEEIGKLRAKGAVQLAQMQRRGLLQNVNATTRRLDSAFFGDDDPKAHIKAREVGKAAEGGVSSSKKHFKKKDKLRRIYSGPYA